MIVQRYYIKKQYQLIAQNNRTVFVKKKDNIFKFRIKKYISINIWHFIM